MSKRSEIIYILHNLHFLLDSGLPIIGCLDILARKSANLSIDKIKQGLLEGKTFHESLLVSYKIPHVMNMFVQIGESCGNLGPMLVKAIETDNHIKKINGSFLGALSYPLFICSVAFVMMLLTMIGIVPKLMPMFRDLHVELPIYTRFFTEVSNLIIHFGLYVLLLIIVAVFTLVYFFKKSEGFRRRIEKILLHTYGIRTLYVRYHTSIIALCISEYMRAGYTFHDTLKIVAGLTRSYAYQEACLTVAQDIQNGKELSLAVQIHERLMPHWANMLGLASQTGRLANQFERFYIENVTYLETVNTHIKRWSEPALMLFIGGIIAIFAVSIIGPIYSVVQHVGI